MTISQRDLFWRLWAAACAAQGWNRLPAEEREAKRKQVLFELGFGSAKHIDPKDGFDAVKAELERLADVVANEPQDAGRRRRVAWCANQALRKLRAAGYPERSIETILIDRFKVVPGVSAIEDLPTDELVKLAITLDTRLKTWHRRDSSAEPPCNGHSTDVPSPVQPDFSVMEPQFQSPSRASFF